MRNLLKSKLIIGLVIFVTFFCFNSDLTHAQGQAPEQEKGFFSKIFTSPWGLVTRGGATAVGGGPGELISRGSSEVFEIVVESAFKAIATFLLWLGSKFLLISAIALNFTIQITILGMKEFIGLPAVRDSWAAFRDLANICFIFILLYISIQTIIKGSQFNTKELLGKVILTAIILNFSLFFTKVVIDASNILALSFHNKIVLANGTPSNTESVFENLNGGLATAFSSRLQLTSLYDVDSVTKIPEGAIEHMILGVFGFLLMSMVAISFFIATIMLVSRLIMLMVYLITSPIAFMGAILPSTKSKITDKWWAGLIGQAFMAPVFFIFTWVTLRIIYSPEFTAYNLSLSAEGSGIGWADIFTGEFQLIKAAGLIFNYIIILGLIVTTIIATKKVSSYSGGLAVSVSKSVGKFATGAVFGTTAAVGRRTIGGVGEWVDKTGKFSGSNIFSRNIRGLSKRAATSSFDVRGNSKVASLFDQGGIDVKAGGVGGYRETAKQATAKAVDRVSSMSPEAQNRYLGLDKDGNPRTGLGKARGVHFGVGGRRVKSAVITAKDEQKKYAKELEIEKNKHKANIGLDPTGKPLSTGLTKEKNDARIGLEQAKAEQRRLEKSGNNVDNQIKIVQAKQDALDELERKIKKHDEELNAEIKAMEERLKSPKNTRQRKVSDIIREEAHKK